MLNVSVEIQTDEEKEMLRQSPTSGGLILGPLYMIVHKALELLKQHITEKLVYNSPLEIYRLT